MKEEAGHPGKTCEQAHPGKPHPKGVSEDYDDKWGKKKKGDLEEAIEDDIKAVGDVPPPIVDTTAPPIVDDGTTEDAEQAAQVVVDDAKNQVTGGGNVAETLLRKKIREVLRNSFNAKP
jgi:hypothetical protein